MAISSVRIQALSMNLAEYRAGVEIVEEPNSVEIVRFDSFWKGEINISAIVSDGKDPSSKKTVVLSINGDRIRTHSCNNPACSGAGVLSRAGLCRHEVAAALFFSKNGIPDTSSRVSTSPLTKQLIREYENRNWAKAVIFNQKDREVRLVPQIHFEEDCTAYVTFMIGREREYLLKDLEDFADRVLTNAQYEYGKNLSFYHTKEAFSEDSVGLVDFIIDETMRESQLAFSGGVKQPLYLRQTTYAKAEQKRQILLDGYNTDRFMELIRGGKIYTRDHNGNAKAISFSDQIPRLKLSIVTYGKDGVMIRLESKIRMIEGKSHIYILDEEDHIHVGDEMCKQAIGPFLHFLMKRNRQEEMAIELNMEDYPRFCAEILEEMWPYVEVACRDDINPRGYLPDPLVTRFYFDMEGVRRKNQMKVTCKLEQSYGDLSFNAMTLTEAQAQGLHRDYAKEMKVRDTLLQYFGQRSPEGVFSIEEDDGIYRLLDQGLAEFMACGEVYVSDQFEKNQKIREMPDVNVRVSLKSGLTQFEIEADELEQKELAQLLEQYRKKKQYYRMKDGSFIKLRNDTLRVLNEILEESDLTTLSDVRNNVSEASKLDFESGDFSMQYLVPSYRMLFVEGMLREESELFGEIDVEDAYRERIDELLQILPDHQEDFRDNVYALPTGMEDVLRPYQKIGFRWLKTVADAGFGGILADEMGLGKTIEVIALLAYEKEHGLEDRSLIVCPASLLYNWEAEIMRFSPSLRVLVLAGDANERKAQLENVDDYDVLITSYDLLRRDAPLYENMRFCYEIIDEAQYIKNAYTLNARSVKAIHADRRFALTGTPIENRLSELWSIFDFCMPGFLYNYEAFKARFEIPALKNQDRAALERLQKICAPFILRRLKRDVLKDLPEKLENVVTAKLRGEQQKLYRAEALRIRNGINSKDEGEINKDKIQILAELTRLRQICCDPGLCFPGYAAGSAKLEICVDLVKEAAESGHKCLLFSQFTTMLDRIKERFDREGITYFVLTGSVPKEERNRLVKRFQKDDTQVFLISLKAGGTGLNLTAADIVIHFDPWWNVAAQNQATDRAHRIGQKHVVNVYKIIAHDTIEEKIMKLQESKQEIADLVINQNEASFGSLTKQDLMQLLEIL